MPLDNQPNVNEVIDAIRQGGAGEPAETVLANWRAAVGERQPAITMDNCPVTIANCNADPDADRDDR